MSLAGLEPAVVFQARVLSPAHIPILLQRRILFSTSQPQDETADIPHSASGGIRTLTEPGLSRLPLPVGIREQGSEHAKRPPARSSPDRRPCNDP